MTQQNKKHFALSMALMALALLTTACYNSADKQAGSTLDTGAPTPTPPTPEGWQRVQSIDGSVTFAIPTDWKMDSYGAYYKHTPNLEEEYNRPENRNHFSSIADVAPASISISSTDARGKTVDQMWEEDHVNVLDVTTTIAGERARIADCSGIRYWECIYLLHGNKAYTIWVQDVSYAEPPPKDEYTPLYDEVRQIINSLSFSE